jgi:serine/threonine protein phosphatase 1
MTVDNSPRTIAIGDVHGCAKTLMTLLVELHIDKQDTLIFLGDYIDRGPDSKGVITCLLVLQELSYNIVTLRGNHEQMLMDSEFGFSAFKDFIRAGGDKTLVSFGDDFFHEMPQRVQDFFSNTKLYYETDTHIFVHAGLNFDKENIFEDEDAMLWARDFSNVQPKLGNKKLVHGHTPLGLKHILVQTGNCINIDGGCVFAGQAQGMGHLVAYVCETGEYVTVSNIDDIIR